MQTEAIGLIEATNSFLMWCNETAHYLQSKISVYDLLSDEIVLDLSSAFFPYLAQCADAVCATNLEDIKLLSYSYSYSYETEFSVAAKGFGVEQPARSRIKKDAETR
jgi:hypothetical protein